MEMTLGYLRESLSNYIEKDDLCLHIYKKLESNRFENEGDFVKSLNTREVEMLNSVMKKEINYANEEQDNKRAKELNEVYELLF
ncbi:sigma-G-dependent sporulation-specific acid-soluble spore protein CsgA [Evansella sp. AB-P1]|uniref:sigma-G-dependent sporulation-specific acid-soluble spore protein CsgA n=1 Tax=Evansella sp. AB-P1 TaxID=3037653 RepID=UPI00241E90F2|nr:sigma-G-dependent sporulation-specific acid-soluble spore protein CsgA [Evansella sp. AB-P1]MDG5787258.1 sigma-G-dependent sporulation-specific acid-soluble spore protein CsgA [Evansella sp. AB-P1]